MTNNNLIDRLAHLGYLRTKPLIDAFKNIDRADFITRYTKREKYVNAPLPIGYGQTISQPLTVAFMLELLEPKPGERILDVGAGSGWQTSILAEIVGEQGKVFAIERIPELAEFGRENVQKYNFLGRGIIEFICADASGGLRESAPFDKIIAAASAQELPDEWKKQLRVGGKIVAPIKTSIWAITKKSENEFEEVEYPGFAFVPLIKD